MLYKINTIKINLLKVLYKMNNLSKVLDRILKKQVNKLIKSYQITNNYCKEKHK
jgi:hypothetical protein